MARTALPGRLTWQLGRDVELVDETPRTKSIVLELPDWAGHRAGQHVDIRLTAPDGYQAQRSYSIASAPEAARLAIAVERVEDGEVSPYLVDSVQAGDRFELRGPIGGWFVWNADKPAVGVAGGSGAVPLVAMLRHARDRGVPDLLRVAVSARTALDGPFPDELERAGSYRVYQDPADLLRHLDEVGVRASR